MIKIKGSFSSSTQRLDESFSSRAMHKNLTGQSDVEIDTSGTIVSPTGNIQPSPHTQQGGTADNSSDE